MSIRKTSSNAVNDVVALKDGDNSNHNATAYNFSIDLPGSILVDRAMKNMSRWCVLMFISVFFSTCTSDPLDDPIPPTSFPDKVLNLNLPDNIVLRNKGASREYNDIGVRGVIVYCVDVGVYHTYERNCSYQPNEACATVNIDISTLFMVDPCCNSTFDFNTGMPSGGVAFRPLRQYKTTFNGTDLVITDEVVE